MNTCIDAGGARVVLEEEFCSSFGCAHHMPDGGIVRLNHDKTTGKNRNGADARFDIEIPQEWRSTRKRFEGLL